MGGAGGKDVKGRPTSVELPLCDPCQANDKHRAAVSYCTDCRKYLCPECKGIHRKAPRTKTHILFHNTDISEGRALPTEGGSDKPTDSDKPTEDNPYLCAEINTQTPTDSKTCNIWGMDILADGRLLVSDCNNGTVKLYNTDHTLAARVQLQSAPTDIVAVSLNEVVACMPLNNVQFLSVSDTLTPGQVIQTGECRSVVACGDKLVACSTWDIPGKIVKLGDRRVATIWTSPGGSIRCVRRLTDDTLCVSHDDAVTCLTLDGEVVGEYTAHNLTSPVGITKHRDGSFYVCGELSDNIHHVSTECNQTDVLCQGKVVHPWAICYNHVDNTLYVSEKYTYVVKVFKL